MSVVDSVGGTLNVLRDRNARSRPRVNAQVYVLLLGQIRDWVIRRQGCSHFGLLWNVGRWTWGNIGGRVDARRLLLLLRLGLALLLE